jgi:hypothetical protein
MSLLRDQIARGQFVAVSLPRSVCRNQITMTRDILLGFVKVSPFGGRGRYEYMQQRPFYFGSAFPSLGFARPHPRTCGRRCACARNLQCRHLGYQTWLADRSHPGDGALLCGRPRRRHLPKTIHSPLRRPSSHTDLRMGPHV